MRTPKIVYSFKYMTEAGLQTKTQVILAAMTGNANFPTPTPALADVTAAFNDFVTAYTTVTDGDRTQVAIKNQYKATLIGLLTSLGAYVTYIANGDLAILRSSGFDLAKDPSPAPPIGKPANLVIDNGLNEGELVVSVNGALNVRSYLFQYTSEIPTEQTKWESETSTSRKFTLKGLTPGVKYSCRVVAVGSRLQKVCSDIATKIVQ